MPGELVLDAVMLGVLVPGDYAGVLALVPNRDIRRGGEKESPLAPIDQGISPEFLNKVKDALKKLS